MWKPTFLYNHSENFRDTDWKFEVLVLVSHPPHNTTCVAVNKQISVILKSEGVI